MKNICFFFLSLLTFTLMSFAMNPVKYINKSKGHGVQRPGTIPNCNEINIFQACQNSIMSWNNFQSQKRAKTAGEFEFDIWLNKSNEAIFEFNKNEVSNFLPSQRGVTKYYHLLEDLEISNPELLQDIGYHQPVLVLPKGNYELQAGLFKYTVTIPLKTNQLGH